MSNSPRKHSSSGWKRRNGNILEMSMIILPYSIRKDILAKSFMLSRNNTTITVSVPTDTHPFDESYIELKPQTQHIIWQRCWTNSQKICNQKLCLGSSAHKSHKRTSWRLCTDIDWHYQQVLTEWKIFWQAKNLVVWSLMKKANLPPEDKNYCQVSNLSCMTK